MAGRYRNLKETRPKTLVGAENLFGKALEGAGFTPRLYAVFEVWDRILGDEAGKARAVGIKRDKLHVEVDSPTRLHDLILQKSGLLKRLNQHFGSPVLSDIMISLADSRRKDGREPKITF